MNTSPQHYSNFLVIRDFTVKCAYGDTPAALFGGIATRLSCRAKVPALEVKGIDNIIETPFWAATEEFSSAMDIRLRLQELYQGALEQIPGNDYPANQILIVNFLSTAAALQTQLFQSCLERSQPELSSSTVRQEILTDSPTSHVQQILDDFQQGPWQYLLLGVADCLTDKNLILDALEKGNCCSTLNPDHRLMGEGAAYLIIEKAQTLQDGQIIIAGLSCQNEPNTGLAASKPTQALAISINNALIQSKICATEIDTIISGYVPDMRGTLEWHQTERQLFPERGSRPSDIEELNPHLGIGDCGAANLFLALTLACGRFDFNYEPVATIMICDFSSPAQRGAMCLRRQNNNEMKTAEV